jgi:hypothetical protein
MRRLNIQIRAMLKEGERAAWMNASFVDRLQHSLLWQERRGGLGLPMVEIGAEIAEQEWESEWEEGEREWCN